MEGFSFKSGATMILSDQELITQFKDKESSDIAFNRIILKYQEKIYWHIRRMVLDHDDADDILQEVFIKAWKGLDKFREESKLYTWLYQIASNESLTYLKKKKRRFFLNVDDVENELENSFKNEQFFSGDEIQEKLQKALLQLPEKQRIVFNMKYYDEIKYEDMSEILKTSVGALKASYHHAVKKIESFLTSH